MKRSNALAVFMLSGLFVIGQTPWAFGFAYRFPTQSTLGLAKGNAVATEMNEPSSVYYNPAATAFSTGTQFSIGSQFVTSQHKHELDRLGIEEHSKRKNAYVPNIYTTINFKEWGLENFTLGAGVSSPFGLSVVWKQDSLIAPVIEKAQLKVADYQITGALKVNDQFSVASGIDITYSEAELQRRVDFGALVGAPRALDGIAEFKGHDTSVGFSASALYKPAENHTLALTFRSQQTPKLEGRVRIERVPAFLGLPATLKGDAEANVNYPAILQGAYGYQMGKLKLEFLLDWARWQNVNKLLVRSTSNPFIPNLLYQADFNNVFTYNASATYAVCPGFDAHLGFIWTETPIPDNTFNAIIPDSDRFGLSCGFTTKIKDLEVVTAFQWVHFEGRSIDNNVGAPFTTVDGEYDTEAFVVGVNATYRY